MNLPTKLSALTRNGLLLFAFLYSFNLFSQKTCPASWNEWQWPTHTNWYFGYHNKMNFGTGSSAPTASALTGAVSWGEKSYESCATASDNNGNIVIMTNGVKVWDGTGAEIPVPGGRLLTGAETAVGDAGSAVQGVFIAKHPLDVENYYIFTTDDAIAGENGITNGFNYYVYSVITNSITGPTRLQTAAGANYRCTEQVAGTFHRNGIDVWISAHESTAGGTRKFLSYLLTCNGLEEVPVESSTGFVVQANPGPGGRANERSSLQFSWDGTRAGATYHNGAGTWDPAGSITIMDFDNLNGIFSNGIKAAPNDVNHSAPYDCEFSPSGNRLYVSFQCNVGSEIGYVDMGTGAYTAALNFDANKSGSLKLGGDGKIYTGTFKDCAGWAYGTTVGAISNPDGAPTYNGSAINPPGNVGWGLGNMFIAPRDWLEIQDPQPLTECDLPVNLACLWECKGTDAENTPLYENAWSVKPGEGTTIDPVTGVFDAPSDGVYTVYFEICTIKDTLTFTVGTCGCDVDVDVTDPICVGETVDLDALVLQNSGTGVWTIDSVPSNPGVDAIIDDSGADTIFDASAVGTKYGVYKLMFRVDDTCEDSVYIEVKKIPTVVIDPTGPFCDDSVAVVMTAIPVLGGDVVGAWQINGGFPFLTGDFDPIATGVGTHEVVYGVDSLGCVNSDTIDVIVYERPTPLITQVGPYCANDPVVALTVAPDSGVWSGTGVNALGVFNPSNAGAGDHEIRYDIFGMCGAYDTMTIHVDIVHDATIATPSDTMCEDDPAIALNVAEAGGTWYIDVVGAGNELGGTSFDPAVHGIGEFELIYVIGDPCGDMDTILMKVDPTKDATITALKTEYCENDAKETFTAAQAGGTWSGNGMNAATGEFDPATSGTGTFWIKYTLVDPCGDVDSVEITVNAVKDATINTPNDTMSYCVLDPNPTFTVSEDGGTWNNAAVNQVGTNIEIDLATLGVVANEMLIYTQADPCGDKDTIWVTTTNQLDATITQVGPYCDSDDPVKLTVADAGGTFSGTGVDPVTGVFSPVTAGDGTHTITYTIAGNCGDVDNIDIVVERTPDPTITNATFDFCEDHGDEILTTVEAGGTWTELNPANGGFTGATSTFNTVNSGDGTFKLEYSFGGLCPAKDTITLNVTALPVITFTPQDTLCADAAAVQINVIANPSTSGTWSGSVNGTGMFDPAGKLGDNNIFYDALNGVCPAKDTLVVHVLPREDASIDPVATQCVSSPSFNLVSSVGNVTGTWTGTGITDNANGTFDPATAGIGTHTITHTVSGRCGDTKTIDIEVVGAPDPTINSPAVVCAGTSTFNLTTLTAGGTWSGDVNPDGSFNPTTGGTFEAIYTLVALCPVADTITFNVNEIPATDFSVDPRTGCIPLTSNFEDISEEVPVQSVWDFGNSATSTAVGNVSIDYTTVGCYDVSLTNIYANGCSSKKVVQDAVCTYGLPDANFTWNPNPADVDNSTVTFTNTSSSDAMVFSWDFTDVVLPAQSVPVTTANPSTSNSENPVVFFDSPNGDRINVCLAVANQNGCVDSICKPITIADKFSVFVANAFTPNGDGVNDTFYPQGRNLEFGQDYEFRVYNRWGTLIWYSTTPFQGWDGTVTELSPSTGEVAQIDVYVWRLVVRDPFTGDRHELIGHVSLLR